MWNPEEITKAVVAAGVPLLTIIGVGGRRRRLRNEIRDNLALVAEIEKHEPLRERTLASAWLRGRIVVDLARLSGQNLGTRKAPIKWDSVFLAAVPAIAFGIWTYFIDSNGFIWHSVFPGTAAFLMTVGIVGMLTNRELPPEETAYLPPGAVAAPTETASERVATQVIVAASGGKDDRSAPGGQVDIVYRFVRLLQQGKYEDGLSLAGDSWVLCRAQSWLWNNRGMFGEDAKALDRLADRMLSERGKNEIWSDFVAAETDQLTTTWDSIDLSRYGAAGRRRRLARDVDLVILAPVGAKGEYYVVSATAVPNALTFVVVRINGEWKISNHVGTAPPVPGWPPTWWTSGDPAIDALPDS